MAQLPEKNSHQLACSISVPKTMEIPRKMTGKPRWLSGKPRICWMKSQDGNKNSYRFFKEAHDEQEMRLSQMMARIVVSRLTLILFYPQALPQNG
jgi:hypothetical protein